MAFIFSNISTLLLNNISNIHSEIIIQPDIRSSCFDFKQGKGKRRLHASGWFRESETDFEENSAVSLLKSVFAPWLIEYFDVKSIVLRLFCFVSIAVTVFRVSLSGEVSEKILNKRYVREYFPALVYDQGLYFSIPLNAFILSQSAFSVTLKMSIPF